MRTGDLKILFASNDSIALPVIDSLNPEAVLTIRTTESGRKKRINPIALWAEKNNKKILHPSRDERFVVPPNFTATSR